MEKKCPRQIQKCRNPSFITKDPLCSPHCFHFRKCNASTMMTAFLTVVYISMNLLISPCSAQIRISGNGLEDQDGGTVPGRGSGPCLPEEYVAPIRTSFQKLIPTFNPRSFAIQLNTDMRIQIGPDDPFLVPFLQSYYTTTLRELAAAKPSISFSENGKLAYSAMFLYFNKEYTRFLFRIGVPLSCISYFLGTTNTQSISQLQQLTLTLQKRFLPQTESKSGFECLFGESVTGQQVMNMLTQVNQEAFSPDTYVTNLNQDATTCEKMIFYTRDGTVMAKMPALDIERRELAIPYLSSIVRLGQLEVQDELGKYIATGVNCLDDNSQRWNFTCKVVEWMQNNLVYQIVQSPVCIPGFKGILPFIVSVQKYSETFREHGDPVESGDTPNITNTSLGINSSTSPMPALQVNKTTRVPLHTLVRKRRSIEAENTYDSKKAVKSRRQAHPKKHRHERMKHKSPPRGDYSQQRRVVSYNHNEEGQEQRTDHQRNQGISSSNQVQLPTGQMVNTLQYNGKYAAEKKKYDEELLRLYNKLNDHFEHNHLHISRLDVVRGKEAAASRSNFPPIFYHKTTVRPHPRRHYGLPGIRTATTTTTTTSTTTTTTTQAPFRQPVGFAKPVPMAVPVGALKINAEVYVDENRFHKPVHVVVNGKKVNAQLNVVPNYHLSSSGEIIHVEENPDVSSKLHPVFDFDKPHRTHGKTNHIVRPLNVRKHMLYRKQSRDKRPHNVIDSVLGNGFQTVTNMAKSILPSVFGTPPKAMPLPKMHRFDSTSSQMHNRKGNQRLNTMERGLNDLLRTDQEIPR